MHKKVTGDRKGWWEGPPTSTCPSPPAVKLGHTEPGEVFPPRHSCYLLKSHGFQVLRGPNVRSGSLETFFLILALPLTRPKPSDSVEGLFLSWAT